MKKSAVFAAMLWLLLLFLLAACQTGEPRVPGEGNGIDIPAMNPPLPLPEYPEIDGSTSTVIMHAAIRAHLTDAHFVDSHSQTYAALERLIPGSDNPADVLLAVKYYDATLQGAKNRGADLVITPVAKEGFVFVIHKDNPISSLTQRQLRDIYAGRITNWREVGGKDEAIVPYTRNWDSGSQTAMEDFMGGEAIVGEEDCSIFGMELLLTQVEKAGSPGIGYNIYSWSMGQSLDSRGLKLLAVDGVMPENQTLSDSRYPLMVYTYSYYNSGNEKGKALTDWLLTAEGQSVITSAGYVGIFGALPTEAMPDFYRDENACVAAIEAYYMARGYFSPDGSVDYPHAYVYAERVPDEAQTNRFVAGRGKAVTALYAAHFRDMRADLTGDTEFVRFIVLTREKGGAFEVVDEGKALLYDHGEVVIEGRDEGA